MLTIDLREELAQGLTDIFREKLLMIILYGSVARDEATMESDVDIAILLKNEMDETEKEKFLTWVVDMDIRYDRVFSIVDIQEDKMERWGKILPFYKNVQEEGIVLWKAA